MKKQLPSRGDIWMVDLNPTRGREQAGKRPALVISVDIFNHGPAGLAVVMPISSVEKGIPFHVPISPLEGGLKKTSYIKCEDVRSISKERLSNRCGCVTSKTLREVEARLRILCGL